MSEEENKKQTMTTPKITQMQEFSDEFLNQQPDSLENHQLESITNERDQLRLQVLNLEEKCQRYESQLATTLDIASNTEIDALTQQISSLEKKLKEAELINKELTSQNQELKVNL